MIPPPPQYALGVDLVHLPRLARLLDQHPQALQRLFSPREQETARSRPDPLPYLAARFAAKEAVFKALRLPSGAQGVHRRWREIEVLSRGTAPQLSLSGSLAPHQEEVVSISLSHEGEYALAVVLLRTAAA